MNKTCNEERHKADLYFCKGCRTRWRTIVDKDIEYRKDPDKVTRFFEQVKAEGMPIEAEVKKMKRTECLDEIELEVIKNCPICKYRVIAVLLQGKDAKTAIEESKNIIGDTKHR